MHIAGAYLQFNFLINSVNDIKTAIYSIFKQNKKNQLKKY